MNLTSAFADAAQRHSTKTAIFWGDEEHSFESLFTQATQLAAHLQLEMGVQPGDRVGLWLKNCPQFVPALFAVLACGAVVVPINNFLKPEEVRHVLDDAGIDVIITEAAISEHLPALMAFRPQLKIWQVEEFSRFEDRDATHTAAARHTTHVSRTDDLAVIIYTSGTTGRSKGAMLTHGNLLHNVERAVLRFARSFRCHA